MELSGERISPKPVSTREKIRAFFSGVPFLSWVLAVLVATALEHFFGYPLIDNFLKLEDLPALFGVIILHRQPYMLPVALLYVAIIYVIPMIVTIKLTAIPLRKVNLKSLLSGIPLLAWLAGIFVAVILEHLAGTYLAEDILDLSKIPVLFGSLIIFKYPDMRFNALVYLICIYIVPTIIVARVIAGAANRIAASLLKLPMFIPVILYLALLYAILHFWADINAYRLLTVRLIMIAIILTLSLNVINGYMGEFSCSHPGFMALGAYAASTFNLVLFTNDRLFGAALLPEYLGPFFFPIALIFGGFAASLGALLIAIPSFRTRGDYLAIISLAFMFIVKSAIENLEIIGGPRGMGGQPNVATLPVVFISCGLCIWIINSFVRSILGKATNTVRDDEGAADSMTINTRRTKMTTFMFAAFWAGVAGGLFAHVLRYVNPGTFYFQRLAEILAMMYFGGLNSVYGSIMGAVSLSLLGEALRPLEIFKWIIIPLILILIMIFRPKGLISFKEFDVRALIQPKNKSTEEV